MPWPKTKKNPATNNSNRAIEKKLDRIIELLEQEEARNSLLSPTRTEATRAQKRLKQTRKQENARTKNNHRSTLNFQAIRARDNDRCHWCNRPVEFGIRAARHAGRYMPIDLAKKPFFTEENFAVACNECCAKMRYTPELTSPTKTQKGK